MEQVCSRWLNGHREGKLSLRHPIATKQRDKLPCNWEDKPGGCRRRHCPIQYMKILRFPDRDAQF